MPLHCISFSFFLGLAVELEMFMALLTLPFSPCLPPFLYLFSPSTKKHSSTRYQSTNHLICIAHSILTIHKKSITKTIYFIILSVHLIPHNVFPSIPTHFRPFPPFPLFLCVLSSPQPQGIPIPIPVPTQQQTQIISYLNTTQHIHTLHTYITSNFYLLISEFLHRAPAPPPG